VEQQPAPIVIDGAIQMYWYFRVDVASDEAELDLISPDDRVWVTTGPDVFECLTELRRTVEPLGITVAVNGARLDAWPSDTQRDVGRGLAVFLLDHGRLVPRGPALETLAIAPPDSLASVDEQLAYAQGWFDSLDPDVAAGGSGEPPG
jgi:hypothetical protein